jgi:hypothetical protein
MTNWPVILQFISQYLIDAEYVTPELTFSSTLRHMVNLKLPVHLIRQYAKKNIEGVEVQLHHS